MTFQRLNIRAKKSLPGLYSFETTDGCQSSKIATVHHESPFSSDIFLDAEEDLEDFGARLERCKGSPGKDSISRRKKLLGSLRNLRSLASLHSSPTKTMQGKMERSKSPVNQVEDPYTILSPMPPSLALLDFEQSPSDKPMFELNLHERSISGSSLEVQHSSPMTVPGSAKQRTIYNICPSATDLPSGTIPDTPGPMQRAFNRDPENYFSWQTANPTPLESCAPSTPVLTPLPGTSLSIGDVDPEFVPLPPSINPSMVQIGQETQGYFDMPPQGQSHMNKTDAHNELVCLELAGDRSGDVNKENDGSNNTNANACHRTHTPSVKTTHGYESAKLQDATNALEIAQDQTCALHCEQQTKDLNDAVHTLNITHYNQNLPFRPKQNEQDLGSQLQKQLIVSEGSETRIGMRFVDAKFEQTHECPNQPKTTDNPAESTTPASPKSTTDGTTPPVNFAYIIWESPKEPRLNIVRDDTWGRHTGLYDGSGYGKRSSGPATPGEPDEGVKHVHRQHSPHSNEASSGSLSVHGASSGEEISNGPAKDESPNTERAREWSPLTADEQHDYDSLEFIFRAYT